MSHDPYLDDGNEFLDDEHRQGIWQRGYIVASVLATLFIVGGIAYGGYRVYERGKEENRVQEFSPNYHIVGQQLAVEKKFETAAEVFDAIFADNPNDVDARSWYGCCQNALGNYAEAEEVLRGVPNNRLQDPKQNAYFLACVCASQGKDEEALQFLWEYLLMDGIYPRPDNTFKVSHQLADLDSSGRIQELLDKPQLTFKRIYGSKRAVHAQSGYSVGRVRTEVELDLPVIKMEFNPANDNTADLPWTLICHRDTEGKNWTSKLMQGDSSFGEFAGDWNGEWLRMVGRWIPATGGDEIPALLQMRFDPNNPMQTDFYLFKSYDKSGNWNTAEYSILIYLMDG